MLDGISPCPMSSVTHWLPLKRLFGKCEKNILASATFTSPNRIESDSELDNINVPGNAINISMAHTNRWEWGFAITMNIDGVYLIQAYFAGQTLALRYCPLPSRDWSDWVVK